MKQRITPEQLQQLTPSQQEKLKEDGYLECIVCGDYFWVYPYRRKTARYCSKKCSDNKVITSEMRERMSSGQFKRDKYTFNTGGLELGRKILKQTNYECLRGENNPIWNGGKTISPQGYILIWNEGKYEAEHRLVMEKHIGRKLNSREIVHHINEDKSDNRLENLMLVTSS